MANKSKKNRYKVPLKAKFRARIPNKIAEYTGDEKISNICIIIGSIIYVIGLFLPYYYWEGKPVLTIDVLHFGHIYLLMMIFSGILSVVGLIKKKNYYRILLPNAIFVLIEIFIDTMRFLSSFPVFYQILGAGQFITLFGGVVVFAGGVILAIVHDFRRKFARSGS